MEEQLYLKKATVELHKGFHLLNETFFAGEELQAPAITIQNQGRKSMGVLGWCSNAPRWRDKEEQVALYEINITAEYLNRDWVDTMETLLHEMVHLYNSYHEVKDTSRGCVYHNKKFKAEAEKRGLNVAFDKKLGWAFTSLQKEAEEKIRQFDIDPEAFKIARAFDMGGIGKKGGKKKGNSIKWSCPSCGNIARTTKQFIIKCGDCDEIMEEADAD